MCFIIKRDGILVNHFYFDKLFLHGDYRKAYPEQLACADLESFVRGGRSDQL